LHCFSNNNSLADIGTLRLDSKVGSSFTYSAADEFAFDVYVKTERQKVLL